MPLTDTNLLLWRPHPSEYLGGVQRIYRFPGGYGLSLINSPKLHFYTFAWEAAVLRGVQDDGTFESLCYDTPLTNDVAVFDTEEETNAFIARAAELLSR